MLFGVDQLGGTVSRAALFAAIAILTGRFATGARAFDKPIGQKRPGHRIVELGDLLLAHQAGGTQRGPELAARAVFRAMGAAEIVEVDVELLEIAQVSGPHVGDHLLFAAPFLPRGS